MAHFDYTKSNLIQEIPFKLEVASESLDFLKHGWISKDFNAVKYMNLLEANKSHINSMPNDMLLGELSSELMSLINDNDKATRSGRLQHLKLLETILNRFRAEKDVVFGYSIVGSLSLNIYVEGSDLDLVILASKENEAKVITLLSGPTFADLIIDAKYVTNPESDLLILNLRPTADGAGAAGATIKMDFGLNNLDAIRSANIVATYNNVNPHLQGLIKLLKLWAKKMELSGKDGISSYFLNLMAIHYAVMVEQGCPNYLFNLPTLFSEHSNVLNLHPFGAKFADSKLVLSGESIGKTFKSLFNYYADFNWIEYMPNTKSLDIIPKSQMKRVVGRGFTSDNWEPHVICFEHPLTGLN